MKKVLAAMLMVMVFLCGCQVSDKDTNVSEYQAELTKTQEIEVIPANTSTVTKALVSNEDIADFVTALDIESWELKSLPQTAELAGTFSLSQEDTIKFGETKTDGELHQVCEISCYKETPYITMEVLGMALTFRVPNTTAEYLNSYF